MESDLGHPILILKEDVLNFLDAIDTEPSSEIQQLGQRFATAIQDYFEYCQKEIAIHHLRNCLEITNLCQEEL
jgi:hypothetical protein